VLLVGRVEDYELSRHLQHCLVADGALNVAVLRDVIALLRPLDAGGQFELLLPMRALRHTSPPRRP